MLFFLALVISELHRLVFMRESFVHSHMKVLIIPHVDLENKKNNQIQYQKKGEKVWSN